MAFNVVAEFSEVKIYTRENTADRAQYTAEERRRSGAETVRFYDEAWASIGAGELVAAGRERAAPASTRGPTPFMEGGRNEAAPSGGETRTRVRVFKTSRQHSDSD
ncbi:hypothetical protein SAMN02799631_00764 [Methylobacterium sp. 174MFSha1.1]|uniref:hypothetical protein n=1 Tax=Methylobacterium sp. 174MFSha1.1 TaxID=1502749 RepID=UPI0008E46982|nr:hypothetical protein [Methylobacterium sp. 174MFSha1.1]SFU46516.1 hypothetical protein SAMN02799631_00764 [Methylobacterium sp. 174MFSha1.1]